MLVFHRAPPIRARRMDVSSTQPTAHFSLRLDTHNSFCQTLQQSMAAGGESLEAPKAERQQIPLIELATTEILNRHENLTGKGSFHSLDDVQRNPRQTV